ncbi:MAG: glycosyltransferase [Vicinamibacterales bacterium]
MRVLHLIDSMHGGGAERVLATVVAGLARRGFRQALGLLYDRGPLLDLLPPGVPVTRLTTDHALAGLVRRTRPDVIQTWVDDAAIAAAPVAAMLAIPLIHRIPHIPSAQYRVHPRGDVHVRRLGQALRACAEIVALSETAADDTAAYFGVPRPSVVHNGYPLAARETAPAGPRPRRAGPGPVVLAAGRLSREKGHRVLVDAMARVVTDVPGARCWIAGVGPLEAELRQQIDALALAGTVSLVGFHDPIGPLLETADVFAMPSLYEGFGNALVEAMRAGLPVVASDLPVFRREVLAGTAGAALVPPGDAGPLAGALVGLLRSPAARAAAGAAARDTAARFTADRMVEGFAALYARHKEAVGATP